MKALTTRLQPFVADKADSRKHGKVSTETTEELRSNLGSSSQTPLKKRSTTPEERQFALKARARLLHPPPPARPRARYPT